MATTDFIAGIKMPDNTQKNIHDGSTHNVICSYFDDGASYSAGQYIIHNGDSGVYGGMYVVNTPFSTKPWSDAVSYCSQVTVGGELKSIKENLSTGIHYRGITSTALVDGSTTNPITISGSSYQAVSGDLVISGAGSGQKEFIFSGTKWNEFGSTGTLKGLAFKDNATGTVSVAASSVTVSIGNTVGSVTRKKLLADVSTLKLDKTTVRGVSDNTTTASKISSNSIKQTDINPKTVATANASATTVATGSVSNTSTNTDILKGMSVADGFLVFGSCSMATTSLRGVSGTTSVGSASEGTAITVSDVTVPIKNASATTVGTGTASASGSGTALANNATVFFGDSEPAEGDIAVVTNVTTTSTSGTGSTSPQSISVTVS